MRRSNAFDLLFEPDRYWIASFSGLACIMNDRIVDEVSMADGLSNNLVLQAAKDTLGRIWIRTEDQNLFLYNPQSLSLEQFRMDERESDTGWDYLLEDSEGSIWLADRNRIYKIEPAKSRTSPVRSYDLHGRQTSEVSALVEVENSVWAAYANNLFILDKESSGIHAITADVAYSGMFYDKRSGRVYLGALDRIDVIDHREAIDRIGHTEPHELAAAADAVATVEVHQQAVLLVRPGGIPGVLEVVAEAGVPSPVEIAGSPVVDDAGVIALSVDIAAAVAVGSRSDAGVADVA